MPWDMPQVRVDGVSFCSTDCATKYIESEDVTPTEITLHDPQFYVDRSQFPPMGGDDGDKWISTTPEGWDSWLSTTCLVSNHSDCLMAVKTIEEIFVGPFRAEVDA